MNFTSVSFLFVFLPAVYVVAFFLTRQRNPELKAYWLLAASLYFYAQMPLLHLAIFLILATINYKTSQSFRRSDQDQGLKRLTGAVITLNILVLCFFKYDQRLAALAPCLNGGWLHFRLPIGLSFFIFMQIAHLVDSYQGEAVTCSWLKYLLFSLWFPYILSGPIVKSSEVIPQFDQSPTPESRWQDAAVGVTLISLGLFKKMILVGMVSPMADSFFGPGATWTTAGFLETWMAVIAYVLQIYFDFSGYSDIAIGTARLFSIRLPINFNSPYKALNIIEFWTRWHMTLTRFLTQYVYNPLTLTVIRRRVARGIPIVQQSKTTWEFYLSSVAFPLIATMFISGIWHGAGWTFVIFGLLHGLYLSVNHGWHVIKRRRHWVGAGHSLGMKILSRIVTLVSVAVAFVFFGAPSCHVALQILKGMICGHGFDIPDTVQLFHPQFAEHLGWMHPVFRPFPFSLPWGLVVLTALGVFVLCFPNSQEWLSDFDPSLYNATTTPKAQWRWRPDFRHALIGAVLGMAAIFAIAIAPKAPGFIYFQF